MEMLIGLLVDIIINAVVIGVIAHLKFGYDFEGLWGKNTIITIILGQIVSAVLIIILGIKPKMT